MGSERFKNRVGAPEELRFKMIASCVKSDSDLPIDARYLHPTVHVAHPAADGRDPSPVYGVLEKVGGAKIGENV
jgi:hypothetical protein